MDECVPSPLVSLLGHHSCTTVQLKGWGGIKNGELLARAEGAFDLFITSDQSIQHQQNLKGLRISILELSTNDIDRIRAAYSLIDEAIAEIRSGEYVRLRLA